MDLTKMVEVRMWDYESNKEVYITRSLESIVKDPTLCYMVDVGFYLLNEIRQDIGLPIIDKKLISE